jgi:hypothetical protein
MSAMSGVILTMKATISPKEQRKWICRAIADLTQQDTQDMYRFASTKIPKEMFITHSDGCRLDLSCVSDEIVLQLYNLIRSKFDADSSSNSKCETRADAIESIVARIESVHIEESANPQSTTDCTNRQDGK